MDKKEVIDITEDYIGDITFNTDSMYTITTDNSTVTDTFTVDVNSGAFTLDGVTFDDDNIDLNSITISLDKVMFEDMMPSVAQIEDMSVEYPAMKIAYENFKTMYNLVIDDWKSKQEDDDLPF